jgi:hypothetical protein
MKAKVLLLGKSTEQTEKDMLTTKSGNITQLSTLISNNTTSSQTRPKKLSGASFYV